MNRRTVIRLYFTFTGLCLITPAPTVSAAGPDCPSAVVVRQAAIGIPELWEVSYPDREHSLLAVTFYDGHPREMAALKYSSINRDNTEAVWEFPQHSARGYWLSCQYAHTTAVLSRRLPATVTRCTVRYAKAGQRSGLPMIQVIACNGTPESQ